MNYHQAVKDTPQILIYSAFKTETATLQLLAKVEGLSESSYTPRVSKYLRMRKVASLS